MVPIPTQPTPPNGPTGQVNNSTPSFVIAQSGSLQPAHFIFANLNGTISAWTAPPNPAQVVVPVPASGPVPTYTGLAINTVGGAPFLYAANDAQGRIDVFDGNFANVTNTPLSRVSLSTPTFLPDTCRLMCKQSAVPAATFL